MKQLTERAFEKLSHGSTLPSVDGFCCYYVTKARIQTDLDCCSKRVQSSVCSLA